MRLLFLLALAVPFAQQLPDAPAPLTPPLIRDRFVADMRSKNLEDVLALYTPDATFQSPGVQPISGASALRQLYTQVFAQYDSDITLERPHHHESGDPHHFTGITENGRYHELLTDRSTHTAKTVCGTYTFTYVRNPYGSGWLVSAMEWTTDPCPVN